MSRETTLSRALWPSQSILTKLLMIAGGSFLIAICAQVKVPMLPVPMTLQTLAIAVVGLTFGARMAGITLLAYLAQGAIGLPVFAGGGAGAAYMMGPTAGYLFGFVAMAWLTGWLVENGFAQNGLRTFAAALIPALLLYIPGALWLWAVTPLDLNGAINAGVLPFLIGDVVKSALAALAVFGGWKALKRRSA